MRTSVLLFTLALLLPAPLASQATRPAGIERFDVSGLPKTAVSALEKEILLLLQVHRKGDLKDATRIHMKLAEYYKEIGDRARADDCTRLAGEACEAAEKGVRTSAGSAGTPPFEILSTFGGRFTHTDDLQVTHRWEFFDDGTFGHVVFDAKLPDGNGPTELGWYSIKDGKMRLWMAEPPMDRAVTFELLGKNGAVLDGVRMKPAK
jgi:hypothetical protein